MNKEKNNTNKCPICGRETHKESKKGQFGGQIFIFDS